MQIVGILNITPDSFSDGGLYMAPSSALHQADTLFVEGADIIDIGPESSRPSPTATPLSEHEVWRRLEPILTPLMQKYDPAKISIDTYHPEVIRRLLQLGVGYINDVTGGRDPAVLKLIAQHPYVKYIAMFSTSIPADKTQHIRDLREIDQWMENTISMCMAAGIKEEQLILDPGIGFSTNTEQSIAVLKDISHYKSYGFPLYIGHSRKSFLTAFTEAPPAGRDLETAALSFYLALTGAVDYVRVHNVAFTKRTVKVARRFQPI